MWQIKENKSMKQWNRIFKKHGKVFNEIHEDLPKIANVFKERQIKKILDLGSGTGRHVVYLSKNGFDVYGLDISERGIEITREWLHQENLRADLKIGSFYQKLPYSDNFFDAAISISAIHHAKIEDIRKTIREVERVLKSNGLIFIVVRKRRFGNWSKGKIVEKYGKQKVNYRVISDRTYMPIEGGEKGLTHYLFNKEILRKEFGNFKIIDIWTDVDKRHYCLLGELDKPTTPPRCR